METDRERNRESEDQRLTRCAEEQQNAVVSGLTHVEQQFFTISRIKSSIRPHPSVQTPTRRADDNENKGHTSC